ncbi:hypothetical protein N7447_004017 [Penicillium robsamsonii]|uniref:uncharacterized protein n=1 Tax=Penicillium robsamsonii TaxID=1792511 RepID=UPI002549A561|nr:uncharacterized protein N7447_004017 [Penicillium robsamsonii]KAJ5827254.1 hypothetical protein N7447_004017 [Penicillium robsamsonii]
MNASQRSPKTPKPTASVPIVQNKRWPPMANRNALPYKLTHISKEKLAREATAPDPDLRRCVAHFRLHCGSVSWTENDMKSRISSFDFEDTDEEDDVDEINKELPVLKNRAPANETPEAVAEQISYKSKAEPVAVAAPPASPPASPPTSPSENSEHGFLEKGRNCLEATSKHLWTGGTCIVSPMAG